MWDRFTLAASADRVATAFDLADVPALAPRYNVAPGQPVAAIGLKADGRARGLSLMGWGLVPRGTPDPATFRRPASTRAETAHRLPATRDSLRRRRCLVPADGSFAWAVAGLARVPHHVRLVDGGPMAFAGVWDAWTEPDGPVVRTCCLLTTGAAGPVRHVTARMPAILPPEAWDAWLSPATGVAEVRTLLRPFPGEQLTSIVVGPAVNDLRNDDPECVVPGGRPGHVDKPFG